MYLASVDESVMMGCLEEYQAIGLPAAKHCETALRVFRLDHSKTFIRECSCPSSIFGLFSVQFQPE